MVKEGSGVRAIRETQISHHRGIGVPDYPRIEKVVHNLRHLPPGSCWMSVILRGALRTTSRREDGSAQGWTSTPIYIHTSRLSNATSMKVSQLSLRRMISLPRGK